MINLLPPAAKRSVKREYAVRLASLFAFLTTLILCAFLALLFPTHAFLAAQLEARSVEIRNEENEVYLDAHAAASAVLEESNEIARELSAGRFEPSASVTLAAIEDAHGGEIVLTGFSYERTGARAIALSVRGVAATREDLVAFADTLEALPLFSAAEVPVADLALERNAPFSLTLTLE